MAKTKKPAAEDVSQITEPTKKTKAPPKAMPDADTRQHLYAGNGVSTCGLQMPSRPRFYKITCEDCLNLHRKAHTWSIHKGKRSAEQMLSDALAEQGIVSAERQRENMKALGLDASGRPLPEAQ